MELALRTFEQNRLSPNSGDPDPFGETQPKPTAPPQAADYPLGPIRRLGVDALWLEVSPLGGERLGIGSTLEIADSPIRWIEFGSGVSAYVPDARLKLPVPDVHIEDFGSGWQVTAELTDFSLLIIEHLEGNAGGGKRIRGAWGGSPFHVEAFPDDVPEGGYWIIGWLDWNPEWGPGPWNHLVAIANRLLDVPVPKKRVVTEESPTKHPHRPPSEASVTNLSQHSPTVQKTSPRDPSDRVVAPLRRHTHALNRPCSNAQTHRAPPRTVQAR